MANHHLAIYLNDHLAGATGAIELLRHLASQNHDATIVPVAARLETDIVADRDELLDLMRRLDIQVSTLRKVGGWLSEKLAELKVHLDDSSGGPLRMLEMLEVIALGIEGKRALWTALRSVVPMAPELGSPDYDRLLRRVDEQRSVVEQQRLNAVRGLISTATASPH
jgi:hypothetical protein